MEFPPPIKLFVEYLHPFLKVAGDDYSKFLIILKKTGINTIEEFLQITYYRVDYSKLTKEIEDSLKQKENSTISEALNDFALSSRAEFLIPIQEKLDDQKQIKKYINKIEGLTEEEGAIFLHFIWLTGKLFIFYLFQITEGDNGRALIKNFVLKTYKSYNDLYKEQIIPLEIIQYVEGIETADWDTLILKIKEYEKQLLQQSDRPTKLLEISFYYWKHGEEKLTQLESLFLQDKKPFIKKTKYFLDAFREKNINTNHKIVWLRSITEAFYFLYRSNNRSNQIHAERLDEIAFNLFNFSGKKATRKSLFSCYDDFQGRLYKSSSYVTKKFKDLNYFFDQLGIS